MLTKLRVPGDIFKRDGTFNGEFWSKPNSSRSSRVGGLSRATPLSYRYETDLLAAGSLREPWSRQSFGGCDKTPSPSKLRHGSQREITAESGSDKSQILLFVKTCLPAVDCLEIKAVLGVSEDKASLKAGLMLLKTEIAIIFVINLASGCLSAMKNYLS